LDQLATKYGFVTLDASQPADLIFAELQKQIVTLELHTAKAKLPPKRIVTPSAHTDPATRPKRTGAVQ
jgi:hypothetical protein